MRTIKNFFFLMSSETVSYLLTFLATVYLARILEVSGFGKINFAFSFFALGAIFTNLGLLSIGTRDIAQLSNQDRPYHEGKYILTILSLRLTLAILVYGILLMSTIFISQPGEIKLLIILYGLSLLPLVLSLEWVFLGWERAVYIMLSKILTAAGYYIGIVVLVRNASKIDLVPLIFLLSNVIGVVFLLVVYGQQRSFSIKEIKDSLSLKNWVALIKNALPFGLGGILLQFSLSFNVLFLGIIKNSDAVGEYSAAWKVLSFLLIFDRVMNNTAFPIISRYVVYSPSKLPTLLMQISKIIFIIALPICLGSFVLGKRIIIFLYGENYQQSALLLEIIIWFLLFTMLNSIYTATLIAQHRNRDYLLIIAIGVATNIILNMLLVPQLEALGTTIGVVAQELACLILFNVKIRIITSFINYTKALYKPLIATGVMVGFAVTFSSQLNLLLLLIILVLIYFGTLFLIKGITKRELLLTEI
jgi:O-antigen/teichoic acid export membrane protein